MVKQGSCLKERKGSEEVGEAGRQANRHVGTQPRRKGVSEGGRQGGRQAGRQGGREGGRQGGATSSHE
eukprot:404314-Hanusia_phi.AAC.1